MTSAGVDVAVALVSDTWTDAVRRGFYSTADQTICSLRDSPHVGTVLVADHPRGVASQIRRRARGDRPAPVLPGLRGVRPLSLTTPPPRGIPGLTRRYRTYDWQVRTSARLRGLRDPALITFNIWHAAFGVSDRWRTTVFYAQDDEAAIPSHAEYKDAIHSAYRAIGRSGMPVVAVSRVLLDRIDPVGPGLVVPNGIDAALWSGPEPDRPPRRRPRAVYAGTVDARLDVDAFRMLARDGFEVVVAGPLRDDAVRSALSAEPGITLPGTLGRGEVVQLLRGADVCVLAHHRTPLTEAMSPLKLFEYLASGTPVVATRIAGAAEPGHTVEWVEPGGDHVAGAHVAIRRGRLDDSSRQRLVDELSWRVRHRAVLDLVGAR